VESCQPLKMKPAAEVVRANRADLIEGALIDRQHASAVMARVEIERAARPAPAAASRSIFGDPTPEQRDALAQAICRRFEAYAKGGD
jgi:hypothetical protein